jgi:hypothetical protein
MAWSQAAREAAAAARHRKTGSLNRNKIAASMKNTRAALRMQGKRVIGLRMRSAIKPLPQLGVRIVR